MVVQAGDLVWRNKDPAVEAQARASYESLSSAEMRKVPVDASLSGSLGQVCIKLLLYIKSCQLGCRAAAPCVSLSPCSIIMS